MPNNLQVKPVEGERLMFQVKSGRKTYLVDLEIGVCECQIIHNRSGKACKHLDAVLEFHNQNK
jgi:hypothetical protein